MAEQEQLSIEDFAQRIKAKYPQYKDIPNAELTGKILAKYPQYKSSIKAAKPTLPTYATPENYSIKDAPLDVGIGIETALGIDPMHPISSLPKAAEGFVESLGRFAGFYGHPAQLETLKGLVKAPAAAVERGAQAIRDQDLPEMFQAAGQGYATTEPTVEAISNLELPGRLKEKARQGLQFATGAGAKTTEAITDKFNTGTEKAEKTQTAVNKATEEANRKAATKAEAKNVAAEGAHQKKAAEATGGHKEAVSGTLEANREAAVTGSRVEGVERSLQEGSKRLGEQVKDLDAKIRAEGNEKYSAVRDAVKDDPGTPLAELAQAARHAETNILKGSPETIKQFRDLARKAPEESGVQTSVGFVSPGDPLYEILQSQGAIDTGGDIPFDQLQGYSSEIGAKLARGGLPGDVYQALKYLKDKIDTAKKTIADRNGAGALLRNADSFWHGYMDTFYDSDSAVAKVRESVGTLDPQYYADPFTKGKAAEVGIGKLKGLKTRHAADASAVADLANQLKKAKSEVDTTTVPKQKPIPGAPEIPEKPTQIVAEVKTPRQVERPTPPTAEDVVGAKRKAVKSTGEGIGKLSKFDLAYPAEVITGALTGHPVLGALLHPITKFGTAYALTRPAVIDWLSRPTAGDIAAIEKLPEPTKSTLRKNLQKIIDDSKVPPTQIAPTVEKFLTAVGITNRKQALEKLGRQPQ